MNLKAQIEAILFLTDKPIKTLAIARLLNLDVQVVRQALLELIQDYEARNGALEIADDNGYVLQVKDDYSAIVEQFLPVEMSVALIRTLSAIAIKQPVMQSEIIKIRGAGAYEHIKELLEKELVAKEETGRSPILTTTKRFQEYFRLTKDATSLRQSVKKMEKAAKAAEEGGQTGIDIGEAIGIVPISATEQLSLPVTGEAGLPEETNDLAAELTGSGEKSAAWEEEAVIATEEIDLVSEAVPFNKSFAAQEEESEESSELPPVASEKFEQQTFEPPTEPSFEPGQAFDASGNAEVFID